MGKRVTFIRTYGTGDVDCFDHIMKPVSKNGQGKPRMPLTAEQREAERIRDRNRQARKRALQRAMSEKYNFFSTFNAAGGLQHQPKQFLKEVEDYLSQRSHYLTAEYLSQKALDSVHFGFFAMLEPFEDRSKGFHVHALTKAEVNFSDWGKVIGRDIFVSGGNKPNEEEADVDLYCKEIYTNQLNCAKYLTKKLYETKDRVMPGIRLYASNNKKVPAKTVIVFEDTDEDEDGIKDKNDVVHYDKNDTNDENDKKNDVTNDKNDENHYVTNDENDTNDVNNDKKSNCASHFYRFQDTKDENDDTKDGINDKNDVTNNENDENHYVTNDKNDTNDENDYANDKNNDVTNAENDTKDTNDTNDTNYTNDYQHNHTKQRGKRVSDWSPTIKGKGRTSQHASVISSTRKKRNTKTKETRLKRAVFCNFNRFLPNRSRNPKLFLRKRSRNRKQKKRRKQSF